jgi:hypothetical protein
MSRNFIGDKQEKDIADGFVPKQGIAFETELLPTLPG